MHAPPMRLRFARDLWRYVNFLWLIDQEGTHFSIINSSITSFEEKRPTLAKMQSPQTNKQTIAHVRRFIILSRQWACNPVQARNYETPYVGLSFVFFVSFRCSIYHARRSFYRAPIAIFAKFDHFTSEEVILKLIIEMCAPIFTYGSISQSKFIFKTTYRLFFPFRCFL